MHPPSRNKSRRVHSILCDPFLILKILNTYIWTLLIFCSSACLMPVNWQTTPIPHVYTIIKHLRSQVQFERSQDEKINSPPWESFSLTAWWFHAALSPYFFQLSPMFGEVKSVAKWHRNFLLRVLQFWISIQILCAILKLVPRIQ